jgi:hypothetical protein
MNGYLEAENHYYAHLSLIERDIIGKGKGTVHKREVR